MSQFDQRVNEISTAIGGLIQALRSADTEVAQLDSRFDRLIANANTVKELATSVSQLERALAAVGSGDSIALLQSKLRAISAELKDMNVSKLRGLSDALERQRNLINDLAAAQERIESATRQSSTAFQQVKGDVVELLAQLGQLDAGFKDVAEQIKAMAAAAPNAKELASLVKSIGDSSNKLNPQAWAATADGFTKLVNAINRVDQTKLDALRNLATGGSAITIHVNEGGRQTAGKTQRDAEPVRPQTVETPRVVVTDPGTVREIKPEVPSEAPVQPKITTTTSTTPRQSEPVRERPARSDRVDPGYGKNVTMYEPFIDVVKKLVASNDVVANLIRERAAASQGIAPDKVDLVKIYGDIFRAQERPTDGNLRRAANYGDDVRAITQGHVSIVLEALTRALRDRTGASDEPSMLRSLRGSSTTGNLVVESAFAETYRPVQGPMDNPNLAPILDARSGVAEMFWKRQVPKLGDSNYAQVLQDLIRSVARGERSGDLPAELQETYGEQFEYAIQAVDRIISKRFAGQSVDVDSETKVGYTTKELREYAYLRSQNEPEGGQATTNALTAAVNAPDVLGSIKRELTGLFATIASAGGGTLRNLLPGIQQQLNGLRAKVDALVADISAIPNNLESLIDSINRQIAFAYVSIEQLSSRLALGDMNDVDLGKLQAFAKNALYETVYQNALNGRWKENTVPETLEPGILNKTEDGVYYQRSDAATEEERGREFMASLRYMFEQSGSDVAYVTGAGHSHIGSSASNIDEGVAPMLDHAVLAYFDRINDEIRLLDLAPGNREQDLGINNNDAMLASISGYRQGTPNAIGEYPMMAAVPLPVDPLTAARIAAETAVVQKPGEGYALIAEFGETCSSSILEGFRRAGIKDNLQKTALGFNVVTPSDVLDFTRGLSQSDVGGYSDTELQDSLDRFAKIAAQLDSELETAVTKVSDLSGVDRGYVRDYVKKGTTGRESLDLQVESTLSSKVDKDVGLFYKKVANSYTKTMSVVDAYLEKVSQEIGRRRSVVEGLSTDPRKSNPAYTKEGAIELLASSATAFGNLDGALRETTDKLRDLIRQSTTLETAFAGIKTIYNSLKPSGILNGGVGSSVDAIEAAIDRQDIPSLVRAVEKLHLTLADLALARMEEEVAQIEASGAPVDGDALGLAQGSASALAASAGASNEKGLLDRLADGYKKFNTITSNLGAIINAVREFLRSMETLGPGSILDVTRAVVKFSDSIRNIGYQAGIFSSPANTNRSSTLVDMTHAGVRLYDDWRSGTLGQKPQEPKVVVPTAIKQRTSLDEREAVARNVIDTNLIKKRGFRATLTQEQIDAITNVSQTLAGGGEITFQDFMKIWKDKPSNKTAAEIPQLLQNIVDTYRENVELIEASRAADEILQKRAAAAEGPGGTASANAQMTQQQLDKYPIVSAPGEPVRRLHTINGAQVEIDDSNFLQPDKPYQGIEATRADQLRRSTEDMRRHLDGALSKLSPEEQSRRQRVQAATEAFTAGTGLEARSRDYTILSPEAAASLSLDLSRGFLSIMEQAQLAVSLKAREMGGLNLSLKGAGGGLGSFAFGVDSVEARVFNAAETAIHELTHAVTTEAAYKGDLDIRGQTQYNMSMLEERGLTGKSGLTPLINELAAKFPDMRLITSVLQQKPAYMLSAEEMYSNVAQSYVSGNKQSEEYFRTLYTSKRYDEALGQLKQLAPDVYGDEAVETLRSRSKQYGRDLDAVYTNPRLNQSGDYEDAPDIVAEVKRMFGGIYTAVKSYVDDIIDYVRKLLGFGGKGTATASAMNLGGSSIADVARAVATAVAEESGNPVLRSFNRAVQNPDIYNPATRENALRQEGARALVDILGSSFAVFRESESQSLTQSAFSGTLGIDLIKRAVGEATSSAIDKFGTVENLNKALDRLAGGNTTGPMQAISRILEQQSPLNANRTVLQEGARIAGTFFAPKQSENYAPSVRDSLNKQIAGFGDAIKPESLEIKQFYDLETGLLRISAAAETAKGQMVDFNGSVNAFGEVVADANKTKDGFFSEIKSNLWRLPMEVMQESVEEIAFGFMALVGQIVNVQDELIEVSTLLGGVNATPEEMSKTRADFMFDSVQASIDTGQQFEEGIQTNLQNVKQLGFVSNTEDRSRLAADLSRVQLGAQTAFDLNLDESLATIPAIFSQLQSSVTIPEQIAKGMSESEQATYRAEEALKGLNGVMNGLVVAQRESGASGKDLIQVYANLAASAADAGLEQEDLLSLAAVASVKLTGGPSEISNAIKSIIERTYGSGADELSGLGIETKQLKTDEFGNQTVVPRSFTDILGDAAALREQSPELSKQIAQAMGAQMRAPQAIALLDGVSEQQRIGEGVAGVGPETSQFMDLVTRKAEAFGGQLNKVQSSFALFLNQILFGSGAMDDLGNVIERASELLDGMAMAMKDNPEVLEAIKEIGKGILIGVVQASTVGVNAIGVFAKSFTVLINQVRAFVVSMMQVERVAETSLTPLQRGARVLVSTMDNLQKKSTAAFNPMILGANQATSELTETRAAVNALSLGMDDLAASAKGAAAATDGITPGNALGAVGEFARGAATERRGFWQTTPGAVLKGAGAMAGSLSASVGLDLLMGGAGTENMAEIGLGIAGGIAGFFAGGPGGAIVGYAMAKGAADYFDVVGLFSTSETEKKGTLEAFAESYQRTTATPEEQAAETKANEDLVAASGKFAESLGIDRLLSQAQGIEQKYTYLIGNAAINPDNLKRYREQIVEGQDPGLDPGRRLFNVNYRTGQLGALEEVYKLLNGGPPELLKFLEEADFGNIEELQQILKEMADPTTEIGKEAAKIVSQIESARQSQEGFTAAAQGTLEAYVPLSKQLADIDARLSAIRERNQYLFSTPQMLTQFGPLGSFSMGLDEQYSKDLAAFGGGPLTSESAKENYGLLTEGYEMARASAGSLPESVGLAMPLAQQLGQDVDPTQLVTTLYEGGAQVQQQFTQAIQPLTQMLSFVQEYEATVQKIAALEVSPDIDGALGSEAQVAAQAQLNAALQRRDAQTGMYSEYKAYLATVMQEPELMMRLLNLTKQRAATQRQMAATVIPGTPARFQLPSSVDVSDYSTDDIAEALDEAREKQAELVKMFPEAAKEFAKQQFLLESGGQMRGVTGVSSQYFQQALKDNQQQQQAPELVDLRDKSPEEVRAILDRARALQGQATALAPDLAADFEDDRILVLQKNNDLLMELGVSQEYLKLAMEDNTDATKEGLRGHYNLPGSYRPPTIWDYYDQGGTEAGSENFRPPPGAGDGMVPISFARDLANKVMNSKGEAGGPDLGALGGLIDPKAAALGYPEPGTPGRVIMPPELDLPDGIITSDIIINGKSIAEWQGILDDTNATGPGAVGFANDREAQADILEQRRAEAAAAAAASGESSSTQPVDMNQYRVLLTPTMDTIPSFAPSSQLAEAGLLPDRSTSELPDSLRAAESAGIPAELLKEAYGEPAREGGKLAKSSGSASMSLSAIASTAQSVQRDLSILSSSASSAGRGVGAINTGLSQFSSGAASFGGVVTALVNQMRQVNIARIFADSITSGRIQITIDNQNRARAEIIGTTGPSAAGKGSPGLAGNTGAGVRDRI
jgi:hypothetical protein